MQELNSALPKWHSDQERLTIVPKVTRKQQNREQRALSAPPPRLQTFPSGFPIGVPTGAIFDWLPWPGWRVRLQAEPASDSGAQVRREGSHGPVLTPRFVTTNKGG